MADLKFEKCSDEMCFLYTKNFKLTISPYLRGLNNIWEKTVEHIDQGLSGKRCMICISDGASEYVEICINNNVFSINGTPPYSTISGVKINVLYNLNKSEIDNFLLFIKKCITNNFQSSL